MTPKTLMTPKALNDCAVSLLLDVPGNRCADLASRAAAGHLTAAESLALAILRGGRDGEEGVPHCWTRRSRSTTTAVIGCRCGF